VVCLSLILLKKSAQPNLVTPKIKVKNI